MCTGGTAAHQRRLVKAKVTDSVCGVGAPSTSRWRGLRQRPAGTRSLRCVLWKLLESYLLAWGSWGLGSAGGLIMEMLGDQTDCHGVISGRDQPAVFRETVSVAQGVAHLLNT